MPERPVREVEEVRAEVRDLAARVVVEPAEPVEGAVAVVRHARSRAEPRVPVEARRRRLVLRVADPLRPLVLHVERAHGGDAPDRAVAQERRRFGEDGRRAPVEPDLAHAPVPSRRLHHAPALGHAQRERLLDVDVLAGLERVDRLQRVPVVGRRDDDRVDVAPVEKPPVVLELLRRAADLRGGEVEVRLPQVADRHDLGVSLCEEAVEHLVAAVAEADEAEANAVVRPEHTPRAEGRGHARRRRALREVPSRRLGHAFAPARIIARGRATRARRSRPEGRGRAGRRGRIASAPAPAPYASAHPVAEHEVHRHGEDHAPPARR